MSYETAHATVKGAFDTTPHGAAKSMLEHVLEWAEGRTDEPLDERACETVFAHLVLDDRWSVFAARMVHDAVHELSVTAPAHRGRARRVRSDAHA